LIFCTDEWEEKQKIEESFLKISASLKKEREIIIFSCLPS